MIDQLDPWYPILLLEGWELDVSQFTSTVTSSVLCDLLLCVCCEMALLCYDVLVGV